MIYGLRINHIQAFDELQAQIIVGNSRKQIVADISSNYDVKQGTVYSWYSGKTIPLGRKGEVEIREELFYVLGALLGDGCIYKYKPTNNKVILSGDEKFTRKFAEKLSLCIDRPVKNYINRRRHHWFVSVDNYQLYEMFKRSRENIEFLDRQIAENGPGAAISFIEGYFDAEGCVKVIKEEIRKTPKICLDITNTNLTHLELVRKLLERHMKIIAKYSNQEAYTDKNGRPRKKSYHLRIYKKEYIRRFCQLITTTKLYKEKQRYLQNWLTNGL